MLPKEYRITKNKEFEKIFNEGDSFFTENLNIKYVKNNLNVTRFGIIISQKISKKATIRNKIKRRIREILHLRLDKIKNGYDIVIITKKNIIKNFEYKELERNIEYMFKKSNLFI